MAKKSIKLPISFSRKKILQKSKKILKNRHVLNVVQASSKYRIFFWVNKLYKKPLSPSHPPTLPGGWWWESKRVVK
jgi:hypothetical protein